MRTSIFTQQRQLLQRREPPQRTGSSALSSQLNKGQFHAPYIPPNILERIYVKATAGCGQRPTVLPTTDNSCIKRSKRSGVKDCGPSERAFLGLG